MTSSDTVESELVITFMDENPRPECMSPPCNNEAVWRAVLSKCDCYHVYCNYCREYTDRKMRSDSVFQFQLHYCCICFARGGSVTWERL